jgi:hypothetical protein
MPGPAFSPRLNQWRRIAHAAAGGALLCGALWMAPVSAAPLVDLLASDILPMSEQLRSDLKLTPNQQILWKQTDQKTRAILRQRQTRRERLQAETDAVLHRPDGDFRELTRGYDEDGVAAEQEGRQLREIWLTMGDALDDHQRKIAQDYILDRMQRASEGSGGGRGGSGGREKGGGMGGMGGMNRGGMGGSGMNSGGGSGSFSSDSSF